ncbi:histidinol-phosphate aminotransferase [Catenaria anguillulae PL171]|uniref:histidinol-phosphate transaminase n=1 Tax=Catenaria anguillulae PL171 TaxID=765915 RepID=A0A1Y2I1R1_9FUNG|nr:histidinol-phosphate aminotransferase [Catenaria anguillulae PL171]
MSPRTFDLKALIRPNIWRLHPYRCARDDYSEGILLDANENAYGPAIPPSTLAATSTPPQSLARYPDPHHVPLKSALARFRNLASPNNVFLGVGSDEVIDLVMRVCCTPGKDKILICPPTYGMYSVSADINDVAVVKVPLQLAPDHVGFQLNVPGVLEALARESDAIKVVFLCSPGNPTGSYLNQADIESILNFDGWNGLVVVDEAYIDFVTGADTNGQPKQSTAALLGTYPNLLVSQTFSKSFGMAGARLGVAYASEDLIAVLSKTKAPYNISNPTAQLGMAAMSPEGLEQFADTIAKLNAQRERLLTELPRLPRAGKVLGTNDANFVLMEVLDKEGKPCNKTAEALYKTLAEQYKVVVRFRGKEPGCFGCLRITVGTEKENGVLLKQWQEYFKNS